MSTVNHNGNCWLTELPYADAARLVAELERRQVGFLVGEEGDRWRILANCPLSGNVVPLSGADVDAVGEELLRRGWAAGGPWEEELPDPWGQVFSMIDGESLPPLAVPV